MSKAKKFGAFSGVFTPSILTILGVIMYMRLGWVVGQSGLWAALAIIIIAHIISFSTGLSISSIATDKRIKTGGIYYILSRSLGLPMGGAIGIALFVGTALSISLYVIGFAESFLSIKFISETLGMTGTVNDFRIIGTVVIVLLVVIAFISTSLAIKTQFFILGAIALSLISIAVGFGVNTEYAPVSTLMDKAPDGETLAYIFSIFFPAVTGFTAGVAMSGDLEDPKKNIPFGTMASISVGFIVYMALAIGFAFFINRDILLADTNFLLKVSWIPVLVIMGIWGATLSSALGGILGGPRILQAIAQDRIMPKFFGKGYGPSKEPRNALLLIFLIAEIGILIGELNVIAGVVSMFYLASYGFINLAYWLESWASTDFRPSFRIPRLVGIIGFAACFVVMMQLDLIAMIVAMLIMGAIYFLLKRKQLRLDYGDVWQSVWISVVRLALHRMNKGEVEERNWQPNIILFSGGTNRRPHLLQFGKFLVGRYGLLSNFDLIEHDVDEQLLPKHQQAISSTHDRVGIFARQQKVNDVYDGIEMIAGTYGFSGIEPNTVLMGWARETQDPIRFGQMLQNLDELDLNVLLLDYDKRYGFGKYRLIDIWWRGAGNNGNLALTLAKFIWSSSEWRDARVRLLVVNYLNDEAPKIKRNAEQIFENLRISAEIKIINNQVERRSFYDIIRVESVNSDLIFLGVPNVIAGKEKEFVEKTSLLMQDIGTVLLVKASSQFKKINFGARIELTKYIKGLTEDKSLLNARDIEIPNISYPKDNVMATEIGNLYQAFNIIVQDFYQSYVLKIVEHHHNTILVINETLNRHYEQIAGILEEKTSLQHKEYIVEIQQQFFKDTHRLLRELRDEVTESQKNLLTQGTRHIINKTEQQIQKLPDNIITHHKLDDLEINDLDNLTIRLIKSYKRLMSRISGNKPQRYTIDYKKLVSWLLPGKMLQDYDHILNKWGVISWQYVIELQRILKGIRHSLAFIENNLDNTQNLQQLVAKEQERQCQKIIEFQQLNEENSLALFQRYLKTIAENIQSVSDATQRIGVNKLIKKGLSNKRLMQKHDRQIRQIPKLWQRNQKLMYNATSLELHLFRFEDAFRHLVKNAIETISQHIRDEVSERMHELKDYLLEYRSGIIQQADQQFDPPNKHDLEHQDQAFYHEWTEEIFRDIKQIISRFPPTIDVMSEDTINDYEKRQYQNITEIHIAASRLLDYIIQEEFMGHLQKLTEELPQTLFEHKRSVNDIVRLISFSLQPSDVSERANAPLKQEGLESPEAIQVFIGKQVEKLDYYIAETENFIEKIELELAERLYSVIDKLSLYSFTKMAGNLRQYLKDLDTKKTFSFFSKAGKNIGETYQHLINQFWYRQSKAILLAKKLGSNTTDSKVNQMLNLLDSISPGLGVLQELPFYYRQLFQRKHNYYNEFWHGRERELKEAETALMRYQNGFRGGILITGDRRAGKSFFMRYFCAKYLNNYQIYSIFPPLAGSIWPRDFKVNLSEVVKIRGTYDRIFNQLPKQSVIVIHELELWWEKSPQGMAVVQEICMLISKYSHKCLFLVSANRYSFQLINNISRIEQQFLNIIECHPFDAEGLKNIILFRHQSSGLQLHYKRKEQKNFRSSDYASLFARYFTFSQGNVGIALQAWISNIVAINDKHLEIKAPRIPDTSALDHLTTDEYIILLQYLLHKRLTRQQLLNVSLMEKDVLTNCVNFLIRAGILVEDENDIGEINIYLYNFIRDKLIEKEML